MSRRKPRKIKAWLVTWEPIGNHCKGHDKVAAILNPRLSAARVRAFVEILYVNTCYSLSERMAYVANKKKNPYPAKFVDIDGVPWTAEIHCGHNPFLLARLVDEFAVRIDEHGKEAPIWKERSRPDMSRFPSWTRSNRRVTP